MYSSFRLLIKKFIDYFKLSFCRKYMNRIDTMETLHLQFKYFKGNFYLKISHIYFTVIFTLIPLLHTLHYPIWKFRRNHEMRFWSNKWFTHTRGVKRNLYNMYLEKGTLHQRQSYHYATRIFFFTFRNKDWNLIKRNKTILIRTKTKLIRNKTNLIRNKMKLTWNKKEIDMK